jgi:hypothetical protein
MAADVRVAVDDRDHRLLPSFSPAARFTVSGAGASAAMYAL